MNDRKALVFGNHYIHIELLGGGSGKLESNLKDEERANDGDADAILFNTMVDGLEAVVLAHACAGVDINDPKYVAGVQAALDALENH